MFLENILSCAISDQPRIHFNITLKLNITPIVCNIISTSSFRTTIYL